MNNKIIATFEGRCYPDDHSVFDIFKDRKTGLLFAAHHKFESEELVADGISTYIIDAANIITNDSKVDETIGIINRQDVSIMN